MTGVGVHHLGAFFSKFKFSTGVHATERSVECLVVDFRTVVSFLTSDLKVKFLTGRG